MSVHGDDNGSLIDALTRLEGQGRAVVTINPETITEEQLDELHRYGARGVRLNLKTIGAQPDKQKFVSTLELYADRIRSRGWVIQIYLGLSQLPLIADAIPKLGVPVVIDHVAHPDHDRSPYDQPGCHELLEMLEKRQVWVKFSGTYRFPELPDLDKYIKEMLQRAPTQIVFASDWPHSGGVEDSPNGDRKAYQDYRKVDDVGFVQQCLKWCNGDEDLMRQICVDNPCRLWQYDGSD